MAYLIPRDRERSARLRDRIRHRHFVGFAILCSLALLFCTAALAADGAAAPAKFQQPADKTASPSGEVPTRALHGTVVDEKGTPVPHVKIVTSAGWRSDVDRTTLVDRATLTDAAGDFTLDVPTWPMLLLLWAKDKTGTRMGSLNDVPGKTRPAARIVLHEARSIPVTVVDGKGQPIAGAKVGVAFSPGRGIFFDRTLQNFVRERTDAKGRAVLHLPPEIPLESVWAAKAGAGFDYVLYRTPVVRRRRQTKPPPPDPAKRLPEDSRPIKFVLGGVHTLRVHVLNERHRPLPGIRILASYVERPNRGGGERLSQIDEFVATADATGTAQFDAIPIEALSYVSLSSGNVGYYIQGRATFAPAETLTEVTVVATEIPVLRVQVTYPDGRPALGAQVHYSGHLYGRIGNWSSGDQLYDSPGETVVTTFRAVAYCVVSATTDGFASKMEARAVRMAEPLRPVHLILKPATRLHGTFTVGKERRPAANEWVTLVERDQDNYSQLPEAERLPRTLPLADLAHVAVDLPRHTRTDEQGRFQFDAAPGAYLLGAGYESAGEFRKVKDAKEAFPDGAREFEIKDQKEIVIDLHCEQRTPIKRRVAPNKGLPN